MKLWLDQGPFEDWFVLRGGKNWASLEGTAADWRGIAKALVERRNYSEKRIAVRFKDDVATLYSPRNAVGENDSVVVDDCPALAQHIEDELRNYGQRDG